MYLSLRAYTFTSNVNTMYMYIYTRVCIVQCACMHVYMYMVYILHAHVVYMYMYMYMYVYHWRMSPFTIWCSGSRQQFHFHTRNACILTQSGVCGQQPTWTDSWSDKPAQTNTTYHSNQKALPNNYPSPTIPLTGHKGNLISFSLPSSGWHTLMVLTLVYFMRQYLLYMHCYSSTVWHDMYTVF